MADVFIKAGGKRMKKVLLFLGLMFSLSFLCKSVAYAAVTTNRLGGINRYATAIEICKDGWRDSSDYVILTTGENFPDALCSAPLAKKYNAPILLVEKEGMSQGVLSEISRLKVKTAFIIGGDGVIDGSVDKLLQSKSIVTERLAGKTRYETAIEIAKQVGFSSAEIAVTNGNEFAEALSISSIAAVKQMPIILVNNGQVPQTVVDFLKDKKINSSYILGGTDLIEDKVAIRFTNTQRILGADKYERNINILKKFENDLDFKSIGISTGRDFPDALSGSAFEALTASPIVLVDDGDIKEDTMNFIKDKAAITEKIDVFGLMGAVKNQAIEKMSSAPIVEEVIQFTAPKTGEEIAVITTNKGTIKIKFFPQYAPMAVMNFKTHVKEGYYNGLTFHRVIQDFMIQSGDPSGDGTGGESIWKQPFADEFSVKLHNFRGALSMANSGSNTNGSQFFIVQSNKVSDSMIQQLRTQDENDYSSGIIQKYAEVGGTPWLDYKYSVFGQVFQGLDVVDAIAKVKVDDQDKPLDSVIVQKIEIVTQ